MDTELLKRKYEQCKRALSWIQNYLPQESKKFEKDFVAQHIVYRNFIIVAQNCVDMGSHIVSEKNWPSPGTMKEVFLTLAVQEVLPKPLGNLLIDAVTLRNIIVHNYAELNHRKAYKLIKQSLKFIPQFCLTVLKSKPNKKYS